MFLLVDLRESFSDLGGGGTTKKERKKSSENGQLTGYFQSFFVFLISPEKTVKLYGKVNQQSVLNLFHHLPKIWTGQSLLTVSL